jgi:hypothetical protein
MISKENSLLDLTGKKFGDWTVISRTSNVKGHTRWLCVCSCGKRVHVYTSSLRSGKSNSCGHKKKNPIDLLGKRFGKLHVISETTEKPYTYALRYRSKNKGKCWECLCDCGNKCIVTSRNLLSGNTKSCGCLGIFSDPTKGSKKALFRKYKRSAKKRNHFFNVSFDQFSAIIDQKCFYCGKSPSQIFKGNREDFLYNGIDRLYSNKGYEVDNIVTCCKECNYLKWTKNIDDFLIWLKACYNHLNLEITDPFLTIQINLNKANIQNNGKNVLRKDDPCYYSKNTLYNDIYKNKCGKKRGLIFELSFEEFFYRSQKKCFYCDIKPKNFFKKGSSKGFFYNGLDRINNDVGYIKDNIVTCCSICNESKMNLDLQTFIDRIKKCYEYLKKYYKNKEI